MAKRLQQHISSAYFEAANQLTSKQARRKVVAYVEGYEDIFFWRSVLSELEDEEHYFEVMLPSRQHKIERGKKAAISRLLSDVGEDMIACVDADYDYLLQGVSQGSQQLLHNPYVFHTYAYAIENLQCYAPSLRNVVVSVVLNDHNIFDFEAFMQRYSEIIYPLFVWNIWYYRSTHYSNFTMTQFNHAIEMGEVDINAPQHALAKLAKKVGRMVQMLQAKNEAAWEEYHQVATDLKRLGVTPLYIYMGITCLKTWWCRCSPACVTGFIGNKSVPFSARQSTICNYRARWLAINTAWEMWNWHCERTPTFAQRPNISKSLNNLKQKNKEWFENETPTDCTEKALLLP